MRKKCQCCGMRRVIRLWRRNTRYMNDNFNYMYSCYDCILEDDITKHGDWQAYNSSQYGCYFHTPYEQRSRKDYVE